MDARHDDTKRESLGAAALAYLHDIARTVRFYSRLRVPALPGETDLHGVPDATRMARAVPFAGTLIAVPPALVLAATLGAGLGPLPAAAIAVAASVLTTGAFHEDGLADTADGLGGGHTRERRLEIMKDSRIGSYGGAAMMLALIIRAALVADIAARGGVLAACAALIAIAGLSRAAGLTPLALLPPARSDGSAAIAGTPERPAYYVALAASAAIAALASLAGGLSLAGLAGGMALAALGSAIMTRMARQLIAGQTGDIAGATQQIAELALLAGLAAGLSWR